MEPELSLSASIKNCSMWRIETNTRLAYETLGLPYKDETSKLKVCKSDASSSEEDIIKLPYKFCSVSKVKAPRTSPLNINDLPPELLEQVFRKLSFENVAKTRRVCQTFNIVASSLLNSEFCSLRMNMLNKFQNIKGQMPRRESARRKHPLARESDIVETLHMRLTLLHMTFGKHIERRHCCFFAGEILDEVYRILNYIKSTPNLNRAYKVTDELFDLSQMAMEYFKEHIEPSLPEITYFATDFLEYTPTITSSPKTQVSLLEDSVACTSTVVSKIPSLESMSAPHVPMTLATRKKFRRLNESIKRNSNVISTLRRELKVARRKIFLEQKQINEMKSRCEDYDRKFQNTSRKFSAVLQELNRFKTEFQYWRSKSPATPCSCGAVTPVLDPKDPELFAADFPLEKMSPRSQADSSDDFKPIVPELDPAEPSKQLPTTSKGTGKSCKRKLNLDEEPSRVLESSGPSGSARGLRERISLTLSRREVRNADEALVGFVCSSESDNAELMGKNEVPASNPCPAKSRKLCKRRKNCWSSKRKRSDVSTERSSK